MKYVLLIYGNAAPDELTTDTWPEWDRFNAEVTERGLLVHAEALAPDTQGRTVRMADGWPLVTDGPFLETKEQLAGFYILDCPDADAAADVAAKVPSLPRSRVEVRPIFDPSNGLR